jgi:plasmid replication initiation protein
MKPKNLTVYKDNKVVEASYRLSLNELRVISACIGKINSEQPVLSTDRFELSAKEFAILYGLIEDKAYQTLKEVADQLFERYVIIDNPDPEEPTLKYTKTRWIASIDYIPEKGKIAVYFAARMLPYLGKLRRCFTKYKQE